MGKTTIELPDELLLAAKRRALDERTTLKTLVERGLRRELAAPRRNSASKPITWVVADGGLPPGLDVADRGAMHEFLRSE
jgi:hypothetical protein